MFLFAFADTAEMNLWSQTLMEAIIMTKVKTMKMLMMLDCYSSYSMWNINDISLLCQSKFVFMALLTPPHSLGE